MRFSRKASFKCALSLIILFCMISYASTVSSESTKYEKLYKFLVKLKGWKCEEPEGMQMDMPELKMIQAMREYRSEDKKKKFQALVIVGSTSAVAGYIQRTDMNYEDEKTKVTVKEIDGFQTYIFLDKESNTGSISIILSTDDKGGSFFVVSFEGMNDEEAFNIARKFDWKGMKKETKDL